MKKQEEKDRDKAIADMLIENRMRLKRLQADYNPITGKDAPLQRVKLAIPDFEIPVQWVPVEMMNVKLIKNIAECGTIEKFINTFPWAGGTKPTINKIGEEIIKIREKYDFAFWAYFEINIDDKTGRGLIPFKLNYAQITTLEKCEALRKANKPINIIICKARQWGGSTFCLFYQIWIGMKWSPSHKFSVCAQVNGVAVSITQMFATALRKYKTWTLDIPGRELRFVPIPRSNEYVIKDDKNRQVRNNRIRIGSIENPDNLRGLPGDGVHFSEVSVWPDTPQKRPEDLVKSIAGGILPRPYTLQFFESTPKGAGNFFHRSWLDAKEGKSSFTPVFIPWYYIPHDTLPVPDYKEFAEWLYDNRNMDKVSADSKWRDSGQYYWRLWELGATFEGIQWYRYKRLEFRDHADMASEAPSDDIEAFTFSGAKIFDVYHLEAIRRDCKEPIRTGYLTSDAAKGAGVLKNVRFVDLQDGPLKIWNEPDLQSPISDRYLTVVDVGGRNDTSDWSVIRVFDRAAMMNLGRPKLVAQLRYHTDYDLLAYDAMRLAWWYKNSLLVIESNTLEIKDKERGMDGDMSEYILDIISGLYNNLYARQPSAESIRQGRPRRWGFSTNASTKPAIIGNLIEAVREHLWIERDNACIDELAIYEKNDQGQFSAPAGEGNHDDIVMTTAIGLWVCFREMETPHLILEMDMGEIVRHSDPNSTAFI